MSRYKSEQTVYNPLKKKNIPIWKLDTDTVTVAHFNPGSLTEENKTYHTDFIRYHLHYSDSKYPDRLRRLVNEGSNLPSGRALETERQLLSESCSQR